ncbi:LysR family transcriptional regulator [Methylocystis parvus]|uniref:LysR family transcriptional regulator n=1 Tax=Methylocystis parvus TaxID=134 RepID=UPI003C785D39
MPRLNYQHLYYFWIVAKQGSITRASEKIGLSQPTISSQLSAFENAIGSQLFDKDGRRLTLTEAGRQVFGYAEQIFRLGEELSASIQDRRAADRRRLNVGVVNSIPKLVIYQLLKPAFRLDTPIRMNCYEDKRDRLLAELALHGVDLVLSDAPASTASGSRVYNHIIRQSTISVFAAKGDAARYRENFPRCLHNAPFVLPTTNIEIRRSLDEWFEDQRIRPDIVAEIEDSALLKTFAEDGMGLTIAPTIVKEAIERQYQLEIVGELPEIVEQFYAITTQRKMKTPAIAAVLAMQADGTAHDVTDAKTDLDDLLCKK